MLYIFGFVAVLFFVVSLCKKSKTLCWGDVFPVSQTGDIVIRLSGLPSNLSAGFVDAAGQVPSCSHGYDDSVMIELLLDDEGNAAKISWNVMNTRMLRYEVCGCKKV